MPGIITRSPRHEPIMMMRPPACMCLSAACVATKTPRTLTANTRSKSASVASSTFIGMTVPALFTSTSSRPKVVTVLSTAFLTASASAASAWIATAFPPARSIALTTDAAASAPLEYVTATLAPSAARRFAIAAPMPREPPVTSATLPASALSCLWLMFCPFFVCGRCLFGSIYLLFPRDPLSDIEWAMEECSSCLLTPAQEAHHLDIHQRHLVEVQHYPGAVALHVCLQGLQMRRLQVADQPERRVVLVSLPFNLACHLRCLFPGLCAVCD